MSKLSDILSFFVKFDLDKGVTSALLASFLVAPLEMSAEAQHTLLFF